MLILSINLWYACTHISGRLRTLKKAVPCTLLLLAPGPGKGPPLQVACFLLYEIFVNTSEF
jgi:hypothetical protein